MTIKNNPADDVISIIVPCFNEESVLPAFYSAVSDAASSIEGAVCEFLFIDDGSSDRTAEILQHFTEKDERVRFLTFSRNFGKEAAMYAGLQNASGDYCVFMDADLQHPPALLKNMYHAVKYEGYDCCAGLREDRTGENPIRTFLSRSFYHLIGNACHLDMGDGKGDFRMMNRAMTDSILELKEYNRYMKGIFSFVGFDTKWIPFHNTERAAGVVSLKRLLNQSILKSWSSKMIKKSLEAYFFTLKNKIVFCKKQFQNMSVFCFVSTEIV